MSNIRPEIEKLITQLREEGLRRTMLLEIILSLLFDREEPVAIKELMEHDQINGRCNPASLYRLLSRLEGINMVRRIGLHERSAYYVLNLSNRHHDYVVCVDCGKVEALEMECPVCELEGKVGKNTGFSNVYHELQFYGVCPQCTG